MQKIKEKEEEGGERRREGSKGGGEMGQEGLLTLSDTVLLFFLICFLLLRATPAAYGDSQARGPIGATTAGLHHSHSNIRSKPHVQLTPQLTAMPDP